MEKYGIYARYANATFETLTPPAEQAENWNIAKEYADNIIENVHAGVGLMLKGEVGTGKTTIAICIMRKAIEAGLSAYFLPMASLIDTLFTLRDTNEKYKFEKKMREVKVLIIDDLGAGVVSDFTWAKIDSILTERCNRGLPTFVTGNMTNKELAENCPRRILDRLRTSCAVLNFKGASLRKTAKILRKS